MALRNTAHGTLLRTAMLETSLGDVESQLDELNAMANSGCDLSAKAFDDYGLLTNRSRQIRTMAANDARVGYIFS